MKKILFTIIAGMGFLLCIAQNPIIQNVFTADPAPMVYKDTVFLFTGHDEDYASEKDFKMTDYLCFTTTDMVNWTHHPPVFNTASLGWTAPYNANAAQVINRNGKFYYYISPWSALADGGDCIAVAVSTSPYGPYKDPIGKPLIQPGQTKYRGHLWEDLDPTVLIDDDGQAYMYWGNNALYCVKLKKDMISNSGDIITFDIKDKAAFGSDYEEAPWIFKRNNIYYLAYAAHIPEAIYYATSSTPTGPWKYGGILMDSMAQGSMGNHPGILHYKGTWYFFYMNQDLPNGLSKRRAVCVTPFDFNADGSITTIPHRKEGVVKAVRNLNPFLKTEAETMAWEQGIETALDDKSGMYITEIDNGDYIKVRSVDFGKGASSFEATVAAGLETGGTIEIHLDSVDGMLIGTCPVRTTGGWQQWKKESCTITNAAGVHDLFFVFKGGKGRLFNFNDWIFKKTN